MIMEIGGLIRDRDREQQKEAAADGVRMVARECKNLGIRVAVIAGMAESGALLNSLEDMRRFLKQVESDPVKAALDMTVAKKEKESMADWFRVFGTDLSHIRTGMEARAFLQEAGESGYTGYYECSSNPAAVSAKDGQGVDDCLEKGGRKEGWAQ